MKTNRINAALDKVPEVWVGIELVKHDCNGLGCENCGGVGYEEEEIHLEEPIKQGFLKIEGLLFSAQDVVEAVDFYMDEIRFTPGYPSKFGGVYVMPLNHYEKGLNVVEV